VLIPLTQLVIVALTATLIKYSSHLRLKVMSEINGIGPTQITAIDSANVEQTHRTENIQAPTALADNAIELSPEAQNIQKIEQKIIDLPDVDLERVHALKSSIEGGQYKVDTQQLSNKMINLESLFFIQA
jgi:negative regulator of flagellin synthesis FlgM